MGLASKQELPPLKKESAPWSIRHLLSSAPIVASFTKSFSNPFEWLLAYMLLIIGAGELLGRHISWIFYVLTLSLFLAALIIHLGVVPPHEKEKEK